MSRQDYIRLAEALRYGLGSLQADGFTRAESAKAQEHFAAHIAEALAADNPRFNREHFLDVVRGEKDLNSRPLKRRPSDPVDGCWRCEEGISFPHTHGRKAGA